VDTTVEAGIIGAGGAILGALVGALVGGAILWFVQVLRSAAAHRAAVIAVMTELGANQSVLAVVIEQQSPRNLVVTRDVYTAMLAPLYSGLPSAAALAVGKAYGRLAMLQGSASQFEWVQPAYDACEKAGLELRKHAKGLKVDWLQDAPS
jgi:hypothetical protein